MNREDQRYLDSLTKEELIQERTLLKARILTPRLQPPKQIKPLKYNTYPHTPFIQLIYSKGTL